MAAGALAGVGCDITVPREPRHSLNIAGDMKYDLDNGGRRNRERARDHVQVNTQLSTHQWQRNEQTDQDYQSVGLQSRYRCGGGLRENPDQNAPAIERWQRK